MAAIKFLSWGEDAAAKAASLQGQGLTIDSSPLVRPSAVVGELARLNPAALVLDLDKWPSHSREIALMLRASKSARNIPILFVGSLVSADGLPEKYARLRSELPDVPYSTWMDALTALERLLAEPKTAPNIVPPLRVYTASLAQKLGIVSGPAKDAAKTREIALIGAPEGFVELLGDLPETVRFALRVNASAHLVLCFTRTLRDLEGVLELLMLSLPKRASAWIVYPKQTSKRSRDFNESDVRECSLAAGLVDYKICSVDPEWSAMKFAWRKAKVD